MAGLNPLYAAWAADEAQVVWDAYERDLHEECNSRDGLSVASFDYFLRKYRLNRYEVAKLSNQELKLISYKLHKIFIDGRIKCHKNRVRKAVFFLKDCKSIQISSKQYSMISKLLSLYYPKDWPMYDRLARKGLCGACQLKESSIKDDKYAEEFFKFFDEKAQKEFKNYFLSISKNPVPLMRIADKYLWLFGRDMEDRKKFCERASQLKKRKTSR